MSAQDRTPHAQGLPRHDARPGRGAEPHVPRAGGRLRVVRLRPHRHARARVRRDPQGQGRRRVRQADVRVRGPGRAPGGAALRPDGARSRASSPSTRTSSPSRSGATTSAPSGAASARRRAASASSSSATPTSSAPWAPPPTPRSSRCSRARTPALGVEGVVVRVNDRRVLNGLLETRGHPRQGRRRCCARIDKWDKVGLEGVRPGARRRPTSAGAAADRVLAFPGCAGADERRDARRVRARSWAPARAAARAWTGLRAVLPARRGGGRARRRRARRPDDRARARLLHGRRVRGRASRSMPEIGSVGAGGRYDDLAGLYTNTTPAGRRLHRRASTRLLEALEEQGRLAGAAVDRGVIVTHPETGDPAGAVRARRGDPRRAGSRSRRSPSRASTPRR